MRILVVVVLLAVVGCQSTERLSMFNELQLSEIKRKHERQWLARKNATVKCYRTGVVMVYPNGTVKAQVEKDCASGRIGYGR